MTTAEATPYAAPTAGPRRRAGLAVAAAVAAVGVAATGWISGTHALLVAGAVVAAGVVAAAAPEAALALFLVAGALKDASWLSGMPADLTLLSAGAVVGAVALALLRRGVPPLRPAVALMPLLVAVVAASSLWTPDPSGGLDEAARFETLTFLAFIAPIALIRTRRELLRLFTALTALALLIGLTAVPTHDVNKPLTVAGGIEIELGLDVGVGLVVTGGYLLLVWRGYRWIAALAVAPVLAWVVLASGSRGAFLGAGAALVYVLAHAARSRTPSRRVALALALVGAVAVAAAGSSIAGTAWKKYDRVLFSTDSTTVLGLREYLYERGWEIAVAHPEGVGARGFRALTDLNHPHNILLELADEQGLVAVFLFLALTFTAWRAAGSRPLGPEGAVVRGLILFLGVEALGSLDLNQDKVLWFAFGLAFALPRLRRA